MAPGSALMRGSTNKNNRIKSGGKYCQCDYKLAIINHRDLSQFHRDETNHTYTPDTTHTQCTTTMEIEQKKG